MITSVELIDGTGRDEILPLLTERQPEIILDVVQRYQDIVTTGMMVRVVENHDTYYFIVPADDARAIRAARARSLEQAVPVIMGVFMARTAGTC